MKTLGLVLLCCGIAVLTHAQIALDSLASKMQAASKVNSLDSIRQTIAQLPDSLLRPFEKIDSIRHEFNLAADSIHQEYKSALTKIDARTREANGNIDSLSRLDLPTQKYRAKLDSLIDAGQSIQSSLTSKLDQLKSRTTEKLNALDLPPEYLPELQIPSFSLPDMKGLPNMSSQVGDIGDLNRTGKLGDIGNGLPGQIQGYQNQIRDAVPGDLSQVTQQAQAYQQDIQSMAEGNVADMEKLPETIEQQASKIEGMDELQKQSNVIEGKKARLDEFADPEKAEQKAIEMAKEAAVDHFTGKQEQLKAAMDKISKYKQKYSSVSSIKDLPKRPPNAMKGKPFIERLVPGLYFQYQQKNFHLIDVNPYLGFKISGRFTSGLGWNHRYVYDSKQHSWNDRSRIFGPRAYVDFKLGKGFIAHVEGEAMNSFVPSTLTGNSDTGHREWVKSFMTGIKKEYKIYKNLKGTALIQYNLFNRYYKAPYVDRLNSRIGFEYVLKKQSRKK